jgi:hypothetical protein
MVLHRLLGEDFTGFGCFTGGGFTAAVTTADFVLMRQKTRRVQWALTGVPGSSSIGAENART